MTCWCLKVMYPSVNCRVKRVEYIQSRIFIYIYGKLSIKSLPLTINIFSSNEKIIFYRLLINITDPWFHDSPNRGTLSYFTSLGTSKITTRSAASFRLSSQKNDKNVYNYFFGKLNILLNNGFPRPILTNFPRCALYILSGKTYLGNPW